MEESEKIIEQIVPKTGSMWTKPVAAMVALDPRVATILRSSKSTR